MNLRTILIFRKISDKYKMKSEGKNFAGILPRLAMMAATILLLVKCAQPMSINKIDNPVYSNPGDSVTLHWNIENAHLVRQKGEKRRYAAIDSLRVLASQTKNYQFMGIRDGFDSDTLNFNVEVVVASDDVENRDTKGKTIDQNDNYIGGAIDENQSSTAVATDDIASFFVMRSQKQKNKDDNTFPVNVWISDNVGNFITNGVHLLQPLDVTCEKSDESINHYGDCLIEQISTQTGANKYDMAIIVDNSVSATNNDEISVAVSQFISKQLLASNFLVKYYNQQNSLSGELLPAQVFQSIFERSEPLQNSGLNPLYKTAFSALQILPSGINKDKALIIVTSNSDNSSIIYTLEDVAQAAIEAEIPIFIIGVGYAYNAYLLRYLAEQSGGRFFASDDALAVDIEKLLNAIASSLGNYYRVSVPVCDQENDEIKYSFELNNGLNRFEETINVINTPQKTYSQYQAVALFDLNDATLSDEFDETIKSLGKVLIENPQVKIQLTGNASSEEGTLAEKYDIGLSRADMVKMRLVMYGASEEQIDVRSFGSAKRLYYIEQTPWQGALNRRVEVRWLDPTTLPYEIITGKAATEEQALELANQWESIGYKAYYERLTDDDELSYYIKIWGFSTLEEAIEAKNKLEREYDNTFIIE